MVVALLALVIVVDQATKWWAWRHVSAVIINAGGDSLVGGTVTGWYANAAGGAVLDILSFGLLIVAVQTLVRFRCPRVIPVSGALMLGGWSSNLLDRLGVHDLTAPGSVRGAVDFVHIGQYYYNIADFFIIGATVFFLLALGYVWASRKPVTTRSRTPAPHPRWRTRAGVPVVAGAISLIAVVALGAAHDSGVTARPTPVGVSAYQ
jgi:lipoprotein signal peptidase